MMLLNLALGQAVLLVSVPLDYTVKKTVEYYVNGGSHVFACFVYFTKAFDRVNYWKLFNQLLDNGIRVCYVKLLAFWYIE